MKLINQSADAITWSGGHEHSFLKLVFNPKEAWACSACRISQETSEARQERCEEVPETRSVCTPNSCNCSKSASISWLTPELT